MQNAILHIKNTLAPYYPDREIAGLTRIIIEHISGNTYSSVILNRLNADEKQMNNISNILYRLKNYEPIQYIIGETEFFGLPFSVNAATLIPRPETEELVELIVNDNPCTNLHVLDIGTGSGCIAISLARYLKSSYVSAWDFSQEALDMALRNAERNNITVSFAKVDVLADYPANKKYDIIVSNPPYVLKSEKETMEANVLKYEPHTALFVPDNNALLFYERIADIAQKILTPKGKLYFEINQAKGAETVEMLKKKSFANVSLFKDLSKRDRMVRAELKD